MSSTGTDRSQQTKSGVAVSSVAPDSLKSSGGRMSADDRRTQLVAIGLDLLKTRPIHDLALDEVAAQAGISRTLLFHYFPSKREFYAEVIRTAGQSLVRAPAFADADDTPERKVRRLIEGFLNFVEQSRDGYRSLIRNGSGGDPEVMELIDGIRTQLVPRWLDAAGLTDTPPVRLAVRGWLACLEEIALSWDPQQVSRDELVDLLTASFFAQVDAAAPTGS